MNALPAFLKAKKYKKIKFKFLKTQHLLIKVKVNGVAGNFILDTGASNTCIGFECIEKYSLEAIAHSNTAASASTTNMFTKIAKDNCLQEPTWRQFFFAIFVGIFVELALAAAFV